MIFVNFDGCYCEVLIFYRSMSLNGSENSLSNVPLRCWQKEKGLTYWLLNMIVFDRWFRLLLHVTINIVLMVFELVMWYLNEDIQVYVCFWFRCAIYLYYVSVHTLCVLMSGSQWVMVFLGTFVLLGCTWWSYIVVCPHETGQELLNGFLWYPVLRCWLKLVNPF